MCVIIIKDNKNKLIPLDVLKNAANINPDGLGVVWLDTFKVTYHDSTDYSSLITSRPFIAHFRYATIGAVNKENTHPFVCGTNTDELLMMNGTALGYGSRNITDSRELANELGGIPRKRWDSHLKIDDIWSPNLCRFVSINTKSKSYQIYNREFWTEYDGALYSKSNVLERNIVAVYGTLKKGFSNYYAHLSKSRHIGKGTTKDKYPLVVSGLPYLINNKGVGHNVEVDVFSVDNKTLERLDILEGHPKWYKREKVMISMQQGHHQIPCWVYFNPIKINNNTKFHKSFKSNRNNSYNGMNEISFY